MEIVYALIIVLTLVALSILAALVVKELKTLKPGTRSYGGGNGRGIYRVRVSPNFLKARTKRVWNHQFGVPISA